MIFGSFLVLSLKIFPYPQGITFFDCGKILTILERVQNGELINSFTREKGDRKTRKALAMLKLLGQPIGLLIEFRVDFEWNFEHASSDAF